MIFDTKFPRVSKDMKSKLQLRSEPTRDWFLFKGHTIIIVYGFTKAPYMLPSFLTSRSFPLEYVKHRLYS